MFIPFNLSYRELGLDMTDRPPLKEKLTFRLSERNYRN